MTLPLEWIQVAQTWKARTTKIFNTEKRNNMVRVMATNIVEQWHGYCVIRKEKRRKKENSELTEGEGTTKSTLLQTCKRFRLSKKSYRGELSLGISCIIQRWIRG